MGGSSKSAENKQNQLSDQQMAQSAYSFDLAKRDDSQRQKLLAPAVSRYSAIASGDRDAVTAATAGDINNIARATAGARDRIADILPAGPARDLALSETIRDQASQVGQVRTNAYAGAFDKLANIASGLGSFSLNELGSATSSAGQAGNINSQLMQQQNNKKASTLGFLGGLAGAAGSTAAGFR